MRGCSSGQYTFRTEMHEVIEVEKEVEVPVLVHDHTQLINLDAPDQHPIEAIKGLQTKLSDIEKEQSQALGEDDAMSIAEIYDILK